MNIYQAIFLGVALMGLLLIVSAYFQSRKNGGRFNKYIIFKAVTGGLIVFIISFLFIIFFLSRFTDNSYICGFSAPQDGFYSFIQHQKVIKILCSRLNLLGQPGSDAMPPPEYIERQKTKEIQPSYIADFSDDKVLVGAAHNVFIARVIEQIGTYDDPFIQTQFRVSVIDNIKGNLKDEIVVNQEGGYKDGSLYVLSDDIMSSVDGNDGYILQLGKTYLLATRYSSKNGWYTINPHPNARKTISSNPNLPKAQLEEISRNDPKVQALQEAYKNEILLDADVYHNNTLNSYKSLHPEGETAPEAKE